MARRTARPELDDAEWLRQKYVVEDLSTRQIAVLLGLGERSPNPVRNALIRHGIPRRNYRDGKVRNRESDHFVLNESVLCGSLLGDGGLSDKYHSPNSAPYFRKTQKNRDAALFCANLIFSENPESRVTEETTWSRGAMRTYYCLRTLSHMVLKPMVLQWYPLESGYRKVVPPSMLMDETVLLHWFLDDGCIERKHDRKSPGARINFCSEGFILDDQELIAEKVNDLYGLEMSTYRYPKGTGYRLTIPVRRSVDFYQIIGPCPVPSMIHKWKGDPSYQDIER